MSRGHPVGASGLGMIHELVTQLRHEAGPRQVEGAGLRLGKMAVETWPWKRPL